MVTTSNWHEIMNSVSHVITFASLYLVQNYRLPVSSKLFCRLGDPFDILGSFSNDDELRRRERQKSNRFIEQNNKCITLFCTFLCRYCTTTLWKCLISCFVEDVNPRQRLSCSFPEHRYSLLVFNSRENCQDLTN